MADVAVEDTVPGIVRHPYLVRSWWRIYRSNLFYFLEELEDWLNRGVIEGINRLGSVPPSGTLAVGLRYNREYIGLRPRESRDHWPGLALVGQAEGADPRGRAEPPTQPCPRLGSFLPMWQSG